MQSQLRFEKTIHGRVLTSRFYGEILKIAIRAKGVVILGGVHDASLLILIDAMLEKVRLALQ